MTPLPGPGRWVADGRGEGRAIRVSSHPESGFLIVSIWRAGMCVGTVQLRPTEAADVIGALSGSLAALVGEPAGRAQTTGFLTLVEEPTSEL